MSTIEYYGDYRGPTVEARACLNLRQSQNFLVYLKYYLTA
jgi:hypothetical protein